MPSGRIVVTRRDLKLAAVAFVGLLLVLELGARGLAPRIARYEDAEFLQKQRAVRSRSPSLLILGDSGALHGLMPGVLAEGAYNASVSSGSGIVTRELASGVDWRPERLIYAAVPIATADTWELQRHERHLSSVSELWRWQQKSGELVLSRLCRFFGLRAEIRTAAAQLLRHRRLLPALDDQSEDGFVAIAPRSLSEQQLAALAEEKAGDWFKRQGVTSSIRREALTQALKTWSGPHTKVTLVVMPICGRLRALVNQRFERTAIWQGWKAAASEAGAELLDCSAAESDAAFYDDVHLNQDAALQLSRGLRDWLDQRRPPSGCQLLSVEGDAVP